VNTAEDRRKAGVFLLVALGLLAAVLGVLGGVRFLSRARTYTAEFRESVSGLEPSSTVKYNGVPVGTVRAIRFDPDDLRRILVDFEVRPEVPIKANTRAQLKPQGITGIFYLELYGGTTEAADWDADDPIPSDPSLSAKIGGIAEDLSELVARLNEFVRKNEENITYAIGDFRASAGSIRSSLEKIDGQVERIGGVVEAAGKTVAEAREVLVALRDEVRGTGEAVRRAVGEVESFARDPALRQVPEKLNRTLDLASDRLAAADFRGLVERVTAAVEEFRVVEESLGRASRALAETAEQGRGDVAAALADIRVAANHAKEAARRLKDDPSALLRSRPAADRPFPDPLPPLPEERR
jgi:phospholipid/cholesterol/gamma-HCH transport system substrate-binding protein